MAEAHRMTTVTKIIMHCNVCQTTLASAPVRLQLQTEASLDPGSPKLDGRRLERRHLV